MNRDKRHFIHEYCEHFGCESAAYDQEPNRNVVATACRDKVRHLFYSSHKIDTKLKFFSNSMIL